MGGIVIVGALSVNAVKDAFGERASVWYIETIMTSAFPFYVFIMMAQIGFLIASRDALRFDKYREKTVAKLKKLGCNPEVLDKITTEVKEELKKE